MHLRYLLLPQIVLLTVLLPGCNAETEADRKETKPTSNVSQPIAPTFAPAFQPQAAAPSQKLTCRISGQLFGTTGSGDVKKAAALQVFLIPRSPAVKKAVAELQKRNSDIVNELREREKPLETKYPLHNRRDNGSTPMELNEIVRQSAAFNQKSVEIVKSLRPKFDALDASIKDELLAPAFQTSTDADGKFQLDVDQGDYFLVSDQWVVAGSKLVWVKQIQASQPSITLSLSQKDGLAGMTISSTYTSDINLRHVVQELARLLKIE